MPVKVSVVVPVYNPGPYLEPCLNSLLAQTMPSKQLELIFVDDGSTDGTPKRLRRLKARHARLKVITIPNSGWPGKPRNIGTDAARGEYVMYVDQDDMLEPEALQRMYTLGRTNGADVVLGKVISDFRGVHHNLYREQRRNCDVFSGDLMNSLTPHKMLRTEFLREQGIRFAEGPRRLEDQLFMTKVYFAARAASIVSNYVCYRYLHRSDGRNAGAKRIEPVGYYGNLREVLDVVDAHVAPGDERDAVYRRFLRTEVIGRMGGSRLLQSPAEYLVDLHREVRQLIQERFPTSVDAGLGAALRGHAALLRFGTIADIAERSKAIDSIRATARLTALRHRNGRAVEIDVEARMLIGGEALLLERGASGAWLLPRSISGPTATDEQRAVEAVEEMLGDVVIQHRDLLDEWFLPQPLTARLEQLGDQAEVIWTGTASVDSLRAAGGGGLRRGLHDFTVRLQAFGVTRNQRLGADRASNVTPVPLIVDRANQLINVYDTDLNNLSINVDALGHWLERRLAAATFVDSADGRPMLDLDVSWRTPPEHMTLSLELEDGSAATVWELSLASRGGTRWVASAGRERLLMPAGTYRARLRLSGGSPDVGLISSFQLDEATRRLWMTEAIGNVRRRVVRRSRRVLRSTLGRS